MGDKGGRQLAWSQLEDKRQSRSYQDVATVLEGLHSSSVDSLGILIDKPLSTSITSRMLPDSLQYLPRATAHALMEGERSACQQHENDDGEIVIVFEPEGMGLFMGGLHPRGSLYERPINMDVSKTMHHNFREVLRMNGLRVLTVKDILSYKVNEHLGARIDLENLAMMALQYRLKEGLQTEDIPEQDRKYFTDDYKREVLQGMSTDQLIETVFTNPTVNLTPSGRDTGLVARYSFQPLSNLVYTRDQQICTCKGIVMGRLRSHQRQLEVEIMKFCFKKLGVEVIGNIEQPGFLEGGDFFPVGTDLALCGIGLRSNFNACQQLMDKNLLGTRRLGVVKDPEKSQDRMHLDCVFSILDYDCCLMLDELAMEGPNQRHVDEYTQGEDGKYQRTRKDVEFSQFMRDEGFSIVTINADDQLQYGCNVLNVGSAHIISVHEPSARKILEDPAFKGDIQVIDFSSITSMYGAVHCSSQVIRRKPQHLGSGLLGTSDPADQAVKGGKEVESLGRHVEATRLT